MTWLQRVIYWLSARLIGPVVLRRLEYVEGLEHVPDHGAVVLVANHSSFFDHFLLAAAINGRHHGRMYFLTKAESFSKRLRRIWFQSVGAIPVDRSKPSPDTLREIRRVLSNGDVLCVYPEGTRGQGWPLLPFKTGAVRFGLAAAAPIVPVGISGAQHILPKGAWRPRRAGARIVFGSPLASHDDLARSERVQAITNDAEAAVRQLVGKAAAVSAEDRRVAASSTARLAQMEIESALESDDSVVEGPLKRASEMLVTARLTDPQNLSTEIQTLRLAGLRAMHTGILGSLRLAVPIRRRAQAALRRAGDDPMLHYILGRWHLRMPRVLGGRRRLAVEHLEQADRHGGGDTRYAIGLAEALIATRQPAAAEAVLTKVIAARQTTPRERRRTQTALALRSTLHSGEAANADRTIAGIVGGGRMGATLRRHPRAVIAGWLVLLVLSAPFAANLAPALKAGGFTNPRGQAAKAATTLGHAFGDDSNALLVVLNSPRRDVRAGVPTALAAIRRLHGVRGLQTYQQDPQWLSRSHHTTLIEASLNVSDTAADNEVAPLRAALTRALRGSGVSSAVTGSPALDHDLNVQSQRDVERAELLALPVLLVVLMLVFQSIAAVLASLSIAVIAIAVANAIGYFIAGAVGISILFSNAVTMIGLAVGVDYGLFILKRFREERATGSSIDDAVDQAMASAGRSVLLSGFAVLIALSTLLIPRVMVLSSIALGAGLVTCVALALTVTFLPAVLRVFGARLSQPTFSLRIRRKASGPGTIEQILSRLYRRPAILLCAVALGTAALVYPLSGIRLQVPVASASILPSNDQARSALTHLEHDLGTHDMFPVEVVLAAPRSVNARTLLGAVRSVTDATARDPRVTRSVSITSVASQRVIARALRANPQTLPATLRTKIRELWAPGPQGTVTRLVITPANGPDTVVSHQLVASLRARLPRLVGPGITVRVTGATAQGADFDSALIHAFPLIIAAVALVTLALLALAFGSLLLPLVALALNAVVVSASMGVLVRLFQGGHDQSINSVTPVLLFAVTFGLSMDYMVIMLSRIREFYRQGADHRSAVIAGVGRTAVMVNGAAAIMVAVFISFGSAQISIVRELGIGLAVAIALDALVIRLLVMPAVLLLLGPRTWGRRRPAGPESVIAEPDGPGRTDDPADAELLVHA